MSRLGQRRWRPPAVGAYLDRKYGKIGEKKPREKELEAGRISDAEMAAYFAGTAAGKTVELRRGVGGADK